MQANPWGKPIWHTYFGILIKPSGGKIVPEAAVIFRLS
jgi:hypothetical protein